MEKPELRIHDDTLIVRRHGQKADTILFREG